MPLTEPGVGHAPGIAAAAPGDVSGSGEPATARPRPAPVEAAGLRAIAGMSVVQFGRDALVWKLDGLLEYDAH